MLFFRLHRAQGEEASIADCQQRYRRHEPGQRFDRHQGLQTTKDDAGDASPQRAAIPR
jgi:hypothetical protein